MESDINEDKFEEKIFNSEDEDKNKDTSGTGSTEDFILKNIKKMNLTKNISFENFKINKFEKN